MRLPAKGNAMQAEANTTAQRLSILADLYKQGQASQLMDRTLDKLLAHEAEQARAELAVLQADLALFEQQYGLDSAEFLRRYQAGETSDRMDFVDWALPGAHAEQSPASFTPSHWWKRNMSPTEYNSYPTTRPSHATNWFQASPGAPPWRTASMLLTKAWPTPS